MSTVESIARPRRNGERRRAPTASISKESPAITDRKSGSAGMPRPISYAVFCLKKKKQTRHVLSVVHININRKNMQRVLLHHAEYLNHALLPKGYTTALQIVRDG